jgi:hypothetical protein
MMRDPILGQRVWAVGLQGTFIIVAVDNEHRTVDLEAIDTHEAHNHISFETINPLGGDLRQSRFR